MVMAIGICKFHGTSGLLGSFKQLKQILNFDKFEPPLCSFQFSYLQVIVKNCCDLFQKYVKSNAAQMGDSQPRFKNQVKIAVNFIHREFHGTVRNSRHVYILAENRYSFGLEKSTGSLFLVVCSAKQQHKKIHGYE